MNIVFVSREYPPSIRIGGIGYYVKDIAHALAKLGHNVFVVAASDNTDNFSDQVDKDGVRVIRIPGGDFCVDVELLAVRRILGKIRSISRYLSYRKNVACVLARLVSEYGVDLIEFAEFGAESECWMVQRNYFIPTVIRLHGPTLMNRKHGGQPYGPLSGLLKYFFGCRELALLKKATAITSPSLAMADWVRWVIKNDTGISVIPNSIDVNWWQKYLGGAQKNKSNALRILTVGTVDYSKGHSDLLAACQELRRQGYNIELTYVGRLSIYGHKLKSYSEILPVAKRWFKVIGEVQREHLPEYYLQSDLVVFPSRWEPFGLVCAEAMACGAIVLGSSAGGMSEIIEDGVSGFLIEPADYLALAEKIKEIQLVSSEVIAAVSMNAIRRVQSYFDVNAVSKLQENFYIKVIDNFRDKL